MKKLFTTLLALVVSVGTIFAESGICGDNLTWDLTNGVLTISGNGAMSNFTYQQHAPWDSHREGIKSLIINSGVISIGSYAFYKCISLTSVAFGGSVTSIGSNAFDGCSSLTAVTIPNNVTNIEGYTFRDCSSLTSVTIGENITSIGESAFRFCKSLPVVTIPNSVTSIGACAFGGCSSLTAVTIPNSVTIIGNSAFYGCTGLTSPIYNAHVFAFLPISYSGAYAIPDGIESIAGYAFDGCSSLTAITIPSSVTTIDGYAFHDCTSLTSVTIPNSVSSIKYGAFYGCTGLTSPIYNAHVFAFLPISYSGAYAIPDGIETIADGAFDGCTGLTAVTIPNSVTTIGSAAFSDCSSLSSVVIPSGDIKRDAFRGCSNLISVTFGNSVTSIGSGVFYGCSGLTSVIIPNSVTNIGNGAFYGCSGLTSVIIPNRVTNIDDYTFYECNSLISIEIPNSVTTIGRNAFYACHRLTSVTIGNSVTSIGNNAFYECNSLTDIYATCGDLERVQQLFPEDNRVKYKPFTSKDVAVKATNGHVSVTIGEGATLCDATVSAICDASPDDCFYFVRWADGNTENPRTIEVRQGDVIEAIFDYQISGKCGKDNVLTWTLDTITMALNITGKGSLSENYTYGPCIESLTIGNEISSIGKEAFKNFKNLQNIILGSSVRILEENAFDDCTAVQTITCYTQRPLTVKDNALNHIDYNAIVYVPADYLETYKMHDIWGMYDVRPIGAAPTEATDVKVATTDNTATIVWPAVESAYTYELVIKDKDGNVICTLVFNAQGQLLSIAFNAPANGKAPQQTQSAGFSFVVTGLEEGTSYDLTITAKDENDNELDKKNVSFHTEGAQGIEDIHMDAPQSTKILLDGQIYILRGGHVYDATGKMVR